MNDPTATPAGQTVSIQLFGAFRQFGDTGEVTLAVPEQACIADVREAMRLHYAGNDKALALLRASAFADDERVLDDAEAVPTRSALAVLPPVCGG